MKPTSPLNKIVPLKMVGGASFGRYPKISPENTFNMLITDNWMVPFPGYQSVKEIDATGEGRGILSSSKANLMFVVIDNTFYSVDENLNFATHGTLLTSNGDVSMAENNGNQIQICDATYLYNYNYSTGIFTTVTFPASGTGITPKYVTFQDTYFIVPASDGQWYLSAGNNGLSFPVDSQHIGEFQTKPDKPIAALRLPGKGNKLLIFGSNVTEPWSDLGLQLFPYQRDTFANIDYGCLNPASIAALENYAVWLASNEQSGPTIMYYDGQNVQRISTDGIGYKLANLTAPEDCYGYLFRQYDHIIYGLTFPTDNYSICYDFTSKKFTTLTDYNFNAFPVKRVTFFNNKYYFVSIYNGNLYEINSTIETYNGNEIPLIRITPTFRLPDATRFIVNNVNFPIEQGQGVSTSVDANGNAISTQFIDISVSRDGGVTFGNNYRKTLNPFAVRPNRFNVWSLGSANEITFQFRFLGYNRFVFTDGEISVYQ